MPFQIQDSLSLPSAELTAHSWPKNGSYVVGTRAETRAVWSLQVGPCSAIASGSGGRKQAATGSGMSEALAKFGQGFGGNFPVKLGLQYC